MDAVDQQAIEAIVKAAPLYATYAEPVDRESAYEKLAARLAPPPAPAPASPPARGKPAKQEPGMVEKVLGSSATKQFLRSAAAAAGAAFARSIFGTAKRKKR